MPHDLFVSYSSKDKPLADALCAHLEARGVRCWVAPRDVTPGRNWGEQIIDAIAAARVMVLIYSAHSNTSQQVLREVERAVSKNVIIVPFRVEDVPMSKAMEYLISAPHWLDAFPPPLNPHLDRLTGTVRRLLIDGTSHAERAAPVRDGMPRSGAARRKWPAFAAVAVLLGGAGAAAVWFGRPAGSEARGGPPDAASAAALPSTQPQSAAAATRETTAIAAGEPLAAREQPPAKQQADAAEQTPPTPAAPSAPAPFISTAVAQEPPRETPITPIAPPAEKPASVAPPAASTAAVVAAAPPPTAPSTVSEPTTPAKERVAPEDLSAAAEEWEQIFKDAEVSVPVDGRITKAQSLVKRAIAAKTDAEAERLFEQAQALYAEATKSWQTQGVVEKDGYLFGYATEPDVRRKADARGRVEHLLLKELKRRKIADAEQRLNELEYMDSGPFDGMDLYFWRVPLQ